MADKGNVSPVDPGGVGQAERPSRISEGGTHFTTFNDGEKWRHSHDADRNGNEVPGSRHTKKQK